MAEALIPKMPVSTLRDLTPVAVAVVGGVILVSNPQLPARNLPELIELLKRNPDRYAYGTGGVGSNGHLTMEWLKQTTHVPYRSVPGLMQDLVAGTIPLAWLDITSPVPFIQQGRLRGIAINGNYRAKNLPELRTMTEQGFPFPALGFQAIFAPANTPMEIVQRVNAEVLAAQALPEYQTDLARLSADVPPRMDAAEFKEMVERNLEIWKGIVKDAHIEMEL